MNMNSFNTFKWQFGCFIEKHLNDAITRTERNAISNILRDVTIKVRDGLTSPRYQTQQDAIPLAMHQRVNSILQQIDLQRVDDGFELNGNLSWDGIHADIYCPMEEDGRHKPFEVSVWVVDPLGFWQKMMQERTVPVAEHPATEAVQPSMHCSLPAAVSRKRTRDDDDELSSSDDDDDDDQPGHFLPHATTNKQCRCA